MIKRYVELSPLKYSEDWFFGQYLLRKLFAEKPEMQSEENTVYLYVTSGQERRQDFKTKISCAVTSHLVICVHCPGNQPIPNT